MAMSQETEKCVATLGQSNNTILLVCSQHCKDFFFFQAFCAETNETKEKLTLHMEISLLVMGRTVSILNSEKITSAWEILCYKLKLWSIIHTYVFRREGRVYRMMQLSCIMGNRIHCFWLLTMNAGLRQK